MRSPCCDAPSEVSMTSRKWGPVRGRSARSGRSGMGGTRGGLGLSGDGVPVACCSKRCAMVVFISLKSDEVVSSTYIVMAYRVVAYILMAYIVMAI